MNTTITYKILTGRVLSKKHKNLSCLRLWLCHSTTIGVYLDSATIA